MVIIILLITVRNEAFSERNSKFMIIGRNGGRNIRKKMGQKDQIPYYRCLAPMLHEQEFRGFVEILCFFGDGDCYEVSVNMKGLVSTFDRIVVDF